MTSEELTVENLIRLGKDWSYVSYEVEYFIRKLDKLKAAWLKVPGRSLELEPIRFQSGYDKPSIFWTYIRGQYTIPFTVTVEQLLAGYTAAFDEWRETLVAQREGDNERARQKEIEDRVGLEALQELIKRYPTQAQLCLDELSHD